MSEDAKLLPPISQINERLTALSREQRRLRTLLALAVEAKTDAAIASPPQEAESQRLIPSP